MRLSVKSEYACLAMIHLARHYGEGWLKIDEIAGAYDMPRKFLDQILLALNRAGYLRSKRGKQGGYQLARQPDSVSVAEIVRLMDGRLAPVESVSRFFYAHSPSERSGALTDLFRELRDVVARKMESTSFAELAAVEAGAGRSRRPAAGRGKR
ncbi:MAG: Rrf2 family transcriptional regulator [bacterium]